MKRSPLFTDKQDFCVGELCDVSLIVIAAKLFEFTQNIKTVKMSSFASVCELHKNKNGINIFINCICLF